MLPFFSIPEMDTYAWRFPDFVKFCVHAKTQHYQILVSSSSSPFSVFFLFFSVMGIKSRISSILAKQPACWDVLLAQIFY